MLQILPHEEHARREGKATESQPTISLGVVHEPVGGDGVQPLKALHHFGFCEGLDALRVIFLRHHPINE